MMSSIFVSPGWASDTIAAGVRDDGDDARPGVGAVTRHERRRALRREAIERVVPVACVPGGDQRVGELRTADASPAVRSAPGASSASTVDGIAERCAAGPRCRAPAGCRSAR